MIFSLYFVDFLNQHAEGLAALIVVALIALTIVGVAFATRKGDR